MLDYCLYTPQSKLLYWLAGNIFGSTGFVDKMRMWFSSSQKITEDLEKYIFNELKMKSEHKNTLKDAMEACKDRGLSALLRGSSNSNNTPSSTKLEWSIKEYPYLESLLLWHLATELCCHNSNDPNSLSAKSKKQIKFCKLLSNYMFHILVMQPTMLSKEMGNLAIVFQDTRAAVRNFVGVPPILSRREARKKLVSEEKKERPPLV